MTFINRSGNPKTWLVQHVRRAGDGYEFQRGNRDYVVDPFAQLFVITKRGHWSRLGTGVEMEGGQA